jgi:hypothetical protein
VGGGETKSPKERYDVIFLIISAEPFFLLSDFLSVRGITGFFPAGIGKKFSCHAHISYPTIM